MKRIILSILIAANIPFVFWLSGVDLTERSISTAICYIWTVAFFRFGYWFLGEDK